MATQTLERVDRLDRATFISLVKKFYKQREIFEKVVNLIEDGIVVIRCDGHVLLANGSAEKMLNVSPAGHDFLEVCAGVCLSN